jgi:hypothetical protein
MAPKKSMSEDPRKKRLKSKAQRDEAPSLDNTFTSSDHAVRFHDDISRRTVVLEKLLISLTLLITTFILESFLKLKDGKISCQSVKFNTPLLLNTFTHTLNLSIPKSPPM